MIQHSQRHYSENDYVAVEASSRRKHEFSQEVYLQVFAS